jgi:Cyclic nucleotide-binding domain/HEAT repeats
MVLSRLFRIQRGEGRTVALVVAFMFLSVAGLTIGESGIDALFFARIGPESLPVIYLAQGAVGVAGMLALSAALGRFERRRAYVALPPLVAAVVAVERGVVTAGPTWIYPAMWLTVTVAYLVQAVYLWGTAGLVTDTRRAKRLFPLFGAGGILGAVVGGLVTRPLASMIGADNLLVVWAVALIGTSALCAAILGVRGGGPPRRVRSRRPSAVAELRQGLAFVRRSSLLAWMSVAAVLFSVLFYSLYLPYAQAATARFPDPDELAGFFGIFWAAVTAAAFLVSMLLTNRLLGWFGAAAMVLVLPLLYAGAFGVLLAISTFQTLVAVRFAVNVWLEGVSNPAWETLVNVTPEDRRDQTRAFLKGGPTQVGTAIAGVVQLVGRGVLTPRQLSAIALVVALLTIAVVWRIGRSYTAALVAAIRAGRPRVFDAPVPNAPVAIRHDAQAVALAVAAMEDADPRMRRLASELLATADVERAAEALHAALGDPDALVRAQAVTALTAAGRTSQEELDRALADEHPRVRRAAVRALGPGKTPPSLLNDDSAAVVAAAAVKLLAGPTRQAAAGALEQLLADQDPATRLRAIRELGDAAPQDVAAFVAGHLNDPCAAVRAAAVQALVAAGPQVAVPAALDALSSPEPVVRSAALEALDRLELRGFEAQLGQLVERSLSLAARDGTTAASVPADGDASELLRAALLSRAKAHALVALSAISVTSEDRDAIRVAVDILGQGATAQVANALETIEAAAGSSAVRSLLGLWEPAAMNRRAGPNDWGALDTTVDDDDPLIRASAELARSELSQGGTMTKSQASMSPIEVVLALRRIPLFTALAPADLQRVADIAKEHTHPAGDVIGAEGELGEEMHLLLDGTVQVVRADGETIARRGPGEVVGELSVIRRAPHVATLIAEGDVRTLHIGYREFEAMVHERPDIALAVMRVLAERLAAMTTEPIGSRA